MTKKSSAKVNKQGLHRLIHTQIDKVFFCTNGFIPKFRQDNVKLWKLSTIIMYI